MKEFITTINAGECPVVHHFPEVIYITNGTSSASEELTVSPGNPIQFISVALQLARVKRLETGEWFSEVAACPGVWGKGATISESFEDLCEALQDWILLKLKDGDKDFPVLGGVNLNASS